MKITEKEEKPGPEPYIAGEQVTTTRPYLLQGTHVARIRPPIRGAKSGAKIRGNLCEFIHPKPCKFGELIQQQG